MSHDHDKKFVYADNAATTSVHPRVLAEMLPLMGEVCGNPSSLHQKGREAKKYIDTARERVAKAKSFKTIQNDVNVLENVIEGLGIEAYQTFEKIRQAAQDGGADMKTLNPILDELQASFSRTGELPSKILKMPSHAPVHHTAHHVA